jgi:tRNA-uridine 2-sulfurtransferase
MTKQRRAVALISGGLDSMLAVKVIQEQGIHVEGINFFTGFCVEGHTQALRKRDQEKQKRNNALWVAEQLGIRLHIIDVVEPYKAVLLKPRHGYGSQINPCLDCKIFMVKQATAWLEAHGFDFMITGEVIGQRPMSQRANTMPIIANASGAEDRLLRPLSATHLPPTLPEREGWVDRERLLGFTGRSRRPQIALARQYGFSEWATPAGGCCFLTDESYARKLKDLWRSQGSRDYELDDILLLKVGRHLRPRPHFKLIIGREEGENHYLEGYRQQFATLLPTSHEGPIALIDGEIEGSDDLQLAAAIVARFTQGREAASVTLAYQPLTGAAESVTVTPLPAAAIDKGWQI